MGKMKKMVRKLLKNFSAAFVANVVNLLVTVFVTLYIPRFSGVEAYSQWQLYLFYTSYLWIIAFGWPDGIYLRYGGKEYSAIEKKTIKAQFVIVICYLVVILPILAVTCAKQNDYIVIVFVLIDSAIEIPREALMKLLQATNRTVEYSKILITSRFLFLVLIFACTIIGHIGFVYMAIVDVGTKAIGLLIAIYFCKDVTKIKIGKNWNAVRAEFKSVLSSGSKLMLGNLCSMFIVGIVRLAIQNKWGLIAFGKVSLTLSISNLFNVFIAAVSLVLFPALKNLQKDKLIKTYVFIEEVLMMAMFGMLLFYYPVKVFLDMWLPQYRDGLQYMAVLFPICVYQSKTSLLASTYQKALDQEKWIFIVNVGVLLLSAITTTITVYMCNSLDLAIFSIVVLLILRNLLSEITVWKELKINRIRHVLEELALTIIFICASWFVGGIAGLAIYAVAYLIYLFIKRNDVTFVLNTALRMVRRA